MPFFLPFLFAVASAVQTPASQAGRSEERPLHPLEVDERSKSVVVGVFDEVSQEFGILKIDLPPRT